VRAQGPGDRRGGGPAPTSRLATADAILRTLNRSAGHQDRAAEATGSGNSGLWRKMNPRGTSHPGVGAAPHACAQPCNALCCGTAIAPRSRTVASFVLSLARQTTCGVFLGGTRMAPLMHFTKSSWEQATRKSAKWEPARKGSPNQLGGATAMGDDVTRREFVRTAAAGSAALGWLGAGRAPMGFAAEADKPAVLGGTPVHKGGWPQWPEWRQSWEPEIVDVLRSGRWSCSGGGGRSRRTDGGFQNCSPHARRRGHRCRERGVLVLCRVRVALLRFRRREATRRR